jgi:hypothetical protein
MQHKPFTSQLPPQQACAHPLQAVPVAMQAPATHWLPEQTTLQPAQVPQLTVLLLKQLSLEVS